MSAKMAIGIDLGGTSVKGVLMDDAGTVLNEDLQSTNFQVQNHKDRNHWSQVVKKMVEQLYGRPDIPIGISAPGLPADDDRSIAIMPGRFPGLEGFDWPEFLKHQEIWVINDARAALIAEVSFGVGQHLQNVLLLTLGTGVGGAAMVDGRILRGYLNRAGHLGHIALGIEGDTGITGTPDSLEMAIGNATVEQRSQGKYANTKALIQGVLKNDKNAQEVWDLSVKKLAIGLSSLINVLSPELIIIGGGISQAKEVLTEPLRKYLDKYEWRPNSKPTKIELAKFLELAGAVGAAGYAFSKHQKHGSN